VRSIHVSAIEPLRLRSFAFLWRPVRHALDVESFGVNAYTQPDAGRELIEEHDETGGGAGKHQELYVVLAGRATFTVGGEEVDAPAGTLVFCDDPAERRSAVAAEAGTTVLAVGAPLGRPYEISPWEAYFRADALLLAGDRAGALAAAAEGVERHPGNASARYNAACYASLAGETAQALAYLSRALELDLALAGTARTDPDLEALRTEPAYHALVARR
jgi:tetratricopeptide (TPR) repeat protein